MTKEEIIELARQAGLHVATDVNWMPVIGLDYAKKLIELATKHTLMNIDPSKFMSWQEGFEAGEAKEREAILDLVDGYAKNNTDLVEAIRARGQE